MGIKPCFAPRIIRDAGWHITPLPPRRGRGGPIAERWEGEVGVDRTAGVSPACRTEAGGPFGIPHPPPTPSAPQGGEVLRWSRKVRRRSRRSDGTSATRY